MPDRDLSYIDDELAANDEFITWLGSDDAADSTDQDPRLADGAAGSFDYYAGSSWPGSFAGYRPVGHIVDEAVLDTTLIRTWGGDVVRNSTFTVDRAALDEQVARLLFGSPPPREPNFDCPPIPGTPDLIALHAARHGLDGYAARAELRCDLDRAMARVSRLMPALNEAFRTSRVSLAGLTGSFRHAFTQAAAAAAEHRRAHDRAATAFLRALTPAIETSAVETDRDRALRLRRERNTGPAPLRLDGRRSRR